MREQHRHRAVLISVVVLAGASSCSQHATRVETQRRAAVASVTPADSYQPRRTPEAMSLLGRALYATPTADDLPRLEADLVAARDALSAAPNDPDKVVWVGRRLGYLWRMREAIDVFSSGIQHHPGYAPLYRHRGHRYISVREFDKAIADLERAVQLIKGKADEVEPDGAPNSQNIPLTTTAFNVWYHLGVARYFKGDFEGAAKAFQETFAYTRELDDNIVAVTDWQYVTLRRLGRHAEAMALLTRIRPDMKIIENTAYFRRLLMYKGLVDPPDVLDLNSAGALDYATLGYGVGYWYLHSGQPATAMALFERVVSGPYWPAFGHIASEVEIARERTRTDRTRYGNNQSNSGG